MPLNMTQIAGMTQDQAILEFHKSISVPSLIILYIITLVTIIITGIVAWDTKSKSKFFWAILIVTIIMTTSLLIFLILLPGTTQNIMNWFS